MNRWVCALAIAACMLPGSASSQSRPVAASMDALELAKQLADFGHSTPGQPLALLTAAQLALDYAPQPIVATAASGEAIPMRPAFDVRQLVTDAEHEAGSNQALHALAETLLKAADARRAASVGPRGALTGPHGATYAIAPAQRQDLLVPFAGGAHAIVRVVGTPGSTLGCQVRAPDGSVLTSDSGSSRCMLNFTPAATQSVHVIVQNTSGVPQTYLLLTN